MAAGRMARILPLLSKVTLLFLNTHLRISMYLVIRCPGCQSFTYVDRYQQWKLCHACGEVIKVSRAPAYLDVQNHSDADHMVQELEQYLHETGKRDLNSREKEKLREEYARWMRSQI
jgi:ribosomal protein S27E